MVCYFGCFCKQRILSGRCGFPVVTQAALTKTSAGNTKKLYAILYVKHIKLVIWVFQALYGALAVSQKLV